MSQRIELTKQGRNEAIHSLRRYFDENFSTEAGESLGELPAGLLLDFFLEEVGPLVYNRAIADAQGRLEQRIADLSGELYSEEFQYWPRVEERRKKRRL